MCRRRQDRTFSIKNRRHSFEEFSEAEGESRSFESVQLLEEVRRLVRKFSRVPQDFLDVAVEAAEEKKF